MAVVIGHRGARSLAPENTLKGIRTAAACKADYIEVDIRLSKDGALVLMHDESVDRTTSGTGNVEDLALEQIRALKIKDTALGRDRASSKDRDKGKDSSMEIEKVPTLEEAVALCRDLGLKMVVEMKEEGIEEKVAEELKGAEAIVTSFYHESVRELKDISGLKTGIIISSLPVDPVDLAVKARADAIFPKRTNPRMFKAAHMRGIEVYPWTINAAAEASWLLRLGADGLVTDDPCMMRSVVDQPLKDTSKSNCEYYPCHHFEGQECTHCYCPLYPCKDADLGRFVTTKMGKRVWTCIDCRLVHRAEVAKYLTDHPGASTTELKSIDRQDASKSQ
ncbi:MAG TPA: glycerophosphodiester phosphodiesterase family protein [Methanotrichaceae archaeon]|nr:glycerophosphodiester phosphodiesterase family protein [Methanotrichaceae archaeon]